MGASGQLKRDLLGRLELLGELALSGDLRSVLVPWERPPAA